MTFQARLKQAMRQGNLRIADLARWFGRRHSTVRGWVVDGRAPAGTEADVRALTSALGVLETEIRQCKAKGISSRTRILEACR